MAVQASEGRSRGDVESRSQRVAREGSKPRFREGAIGHTAAASAIVLLTLSHATVASGGEFFMTATGLEVATPEIASLDCVQMVDVLATIDRTEYRGLRPRPLDPADTPLLDYERRLSAAVFESCDGSDRGQFRDGFRILPAVN